MALLPHVNEAMVARLASLGCPPSAAPFPFITFGLGLLAGEDLASDSVPVYGYWVDEDAIAAGRMLLFALTGTKLVRVEWSADEGALTVTYPLDRVVSVEDFFAPNGEYLTTVKLASNVTLSRITPDPVPDAAAQPSAASGGPVGGATVRSEQASYAFRAVGPERQNELVGFSTVFRRLLGA